MSLHRNKESNTASSAVTQANSVPVSTHHGSSANVEPLGSRLPHYNLTCMCSSLPHIAVSPACVAAPCQLYPHHCVQLLTTHHNLTASSVFHYSGFTGFFFFLIQNHRMQKQPNDFAEHSNESTNESRTLLGTNYTDR